MINLPNASYIAVAKIRIVEPTTFIISSSEDAERIHCLLPSCHCTLDDMWKSKFNKRISYLINISQHNSLILVIVKLALNFIPSGIKKASISFKCSLL